MSTTGHGEAIMKVTLARLILFHMEQGNTHQYTHTQFLERNKTWSLLDSTSAGQSAEAASDLGLAYMQSRVSGLGGVVTVDPTGRWAARFSSQQMAWAAAQGDTLHWGLWTGENFTQNISETS